jgi:hypothetical protein
MGPEDLIYIKRIPSQLQRDFFIKLGAIGKVLQANPNWLMQVFKAESGVDPARRNTYSPFYTVKDGKKVLDGYATGFIQFIPDTARRLGTSTYDLEKMGYLQQLDYVYKYFAPYAGKLKNYFDVYLVVFFPAAIPHTNDDNWVFETKNISRSAVAKANPAIDINKNGTITMGEFKQYVKNTVEKPLWEKVFGQVKEAVQDNKGSFGLLFVALVAILLASGGGGGKKKK